MPSQVKSPVIYIYDINRVLLASNLEKHGMGIVDFKYKFDDEDDDLCHIKIQSSNIEMLEFIQKDFIFESGVRLLVRWGYLGGPVNHYQTVVVRDVKTKYGTNIIWTELECSDLVTFLKTTKSPDADSMSLLQYLESYSFNRYVIAILENGELVYYRKLDKSKHEKAAEEPLWKSADQMHPLEPLWRAQQNFDTGIEKIGYISPRGSTGLWDDPYSLAVPQYKTTYKENLELVPDYEGTWVGEDGSLKQYFMTEFPIMGVNKSPFIVIRDRLRACPGGPWYVTGRGNVLFIHNRNMGGKPYRYYNYAKDPTNLIDFTFTSKYESFAKRTVTFAGMSPLEKTVHYLDNYIQWLSSHRPIKEILQDLSITEAQMRKELKDWFNVYLTSYSKWKVSSTPMVLLSGGASARVPKSTHDDLFKKEDFEDGQIVGMTKRPDGTYHYEVPPQFKHTDPRFGLWGMDPVVAFSYVYSAPVESFSEAQSVLDAANRKLEMDKEEARMIIEGDPSMLSEIIVNIGNIQKFQLGNYYIKSCEHRIGSGGYKCTMDSFRVRDKAKVKSFHSILEADEAGNMMLKDRYTLEGKLFRNWDISIYKAAEISEAARAMDIQTGTAYASTAPGESRTNLLDGIKSEQVDELIDEVMKGGYTIEELDPNVQDY